MDYENLLYQSLQPSEWNAVLHLAAFVFVATEFLKRAWRRVGCRFEYTDVWFISSACGVAGAFYLWPPEASLPWPIAGLIVSGAVSFSHRWALIGLRWKLPALASIISGDRRRKSIPPPGNTERRQRRRKK